MTNQEIDNLPYYVKYEISNQLPANNSHWGRSTGYSDWYGFMTVYPTAGRDNMTQPMAYGDPIEIPISRIFYVRKTTA